jgi:CYTH domain-containing protein
MESEKNNKNHFEHFEIERKFLVKSLPPDLNKYPCHEIVQSYVSTNPTIRIRKWDNDYILTVKSRGIMKRIEFEMELTAEQFDGLRQKTEGITINKKRYIIPIKDETLNIELTAELDIYFEDLSGFMNVEVEFADERTALLFTPPDWFGEEVTQDKRYTNASLSKFGVPKHLHS